MFSLTYRQRAVTNPQTGIIYSFYLTYKQGAITNAKTGIIKCLSIVHIKSTV